MHPAETVWVKAEVIFLDTHRDEPDRKTAKKLPHPH